MNRFAITTYKKLNAMIADAKAQFSLMLRDDAPVTGIAFAFALGTFINLLPLPGADILLGFALLKLCKRLQRAPVLAAMAVWNGFITTPIIAAGGKVGFALSPIVPTVQFGQSQNAIAAQSFLVGNLFVALLISLVAFSAILVTLPRYRTKYACISH
ncbi:MAG: DUF2062 domain-containing protein [Anaerolineae bacterium]|nr:DUF2062 domain-containing protein [Anaerolineae bacterium]